MQLMSLNFARGVVLFVVATFVLGGVFAMGAPLVTAVVRAQPTWSWSEVAAAFPYAMVLAVIGMSYGAVSDWVQEFHVAAGARLAPLLVGGAALIGGAALFIEPALVRLLSPWVHRRDLPSMIFAVSAMTLAMAVTYSAGPNIEKVKRATRGWLPADLQRLLVLLATMLILLFAHFAWLDGLDMVGRLPDYDKRLDPFAIAARIFLPFLIICGLAGFCLRHVLNSMNAVIARDLVYSDALLGIGVPHDYTWSDFEPRRPLRTNDEDRAAKTRMMMALFATTGFAAGCIAGSGGWITFGMIGAAVGLVASSIGVLLVNRSYRHTDPRHLVQELVHRRAYVEEKDGTFFFVVIAEDGTRSGRVTLRRPWEAVSSFADGTYGKIFSAIDTRLSGIDWNVIVSVPEVGTPVLVAETFEGHDTVYRNLTYLNDRFGPAARSRFMRERAAATHSDEGAAGAAIPSEL